MIGLDGRRARGLIDPAGRDQPLRAPDAVALHQQPEACVVQRADHHAAAEMPTAGHRLHAQAVEVDPRGFITMPAPGRRCADRVHHPAPEQLRQRLTHDLQQRIREQVDAHIVVLVVRARRAQRTL